MMRHWRSQFEVTWLAAAAVRGQAGCTQELAAAAADIGRHGLCRTSCLHLATVVGGCDLHGQHILAGAVCK